MPIEWLGKPVPAGKPDDRMVHRRILARMLDNLLRGCEGSGVLSCEPDGLHAVRVETVTGWLVVSVPGASDMAVVRAVLRALEE